MSCESCRDLRVVFRDMIAPERQRKWTCPWAGEELCAGPERQRWEGKARQLECHWNRRHAEGEFQNVRTPASPAQALWDVRVQGSEDAGLGSTPPPTHSGAVASAPAARLHALPALGPLAYTDQEKQAMLKEWAFVRGNGVSLTQHFKQHHQNTLEEDGSSFKACGVTSPLCTLKL